MPLKRRRRRQRFPGLLIVAVCLLGCGCHPAEDNKLGAVQRSGELVVLTRNSPTTYYEGPDGPTGFEYDLRVCGPPGRRPAHENGGPLWRHPADDRAGKPSPPPA